MAKSTKNQAQHPLILRFYLLMDAFAKSDDERDFYLDNVEGFILFFNLDKSPEEVECFDQELEQNKQRYHLIPKLTFFETKKFIESFIHDKIYDVDTKDRLLDTLQSQDARENFLDLIQDNFTEREKWQHFYIERSRIRLIEWLKEIGLYFVFEEDLDISQSILERVKRHLFDKKRLPRGVYAAREAIFNKAQTYYQEQAVKLVVRRGRPPKEANKVSVGPFSRRQTSCLTIPEAARPFLYEMSGSYLDFSAKISSPSSRVIETKRVTGKLTTKLQALCTQINAFSRLDLAKELPGRQLDEGSKIKQTVTLPAKTGGKKIKKIAKGVLDLDTGFRNKPKKRAASTGRRKRTNQTKPPENSDRVPDE